VGQCSCTCTAVVACVTATCSSVGRSINSAYTQSPECSQSCHPCCAYLPADWRYISQCLHLQSAGRCSQIHISQCLQLQLPSQMLGKLQRILDCPQASVLTVRRHQATSLIPGLGFASLLHVLWCLFVDYTCAPRLVCCVCCGAPCVGFLSCLCWASCAPRLMCCVCCGAACARRCSSPDHCAACCQLP
jgi:hypothetical protein